MKVILTNTEACNAVATHYNVHPHEVEIEGKPFAHYPTMLQDGITCPHVRFCPDCLAVYGVCRAHRHDPDSGIFWAAEPPKVDDETHRD